MMTTQKFRTLNVGGLEVPMSYPPIVSLEVTILPGKENYLGIVKVTVTTATFPQNRLTFFLGDYSHTYCYIGKYPPNSVTEGSNSLVKIIRPDGKSVASTRFDTLEHELKVTVSTHKLTVSIVTKGAKS